MTIDPTVLIAFITAILGLLGLVMRQFMAGKLLSDKVVPREDYDAAMALNASYAAGMTQLTDGMGELTDGVVKLTATVERIVPPNGAR